MKKVIANICLIIVFFIIYFLQANFFTWFTIAGVMPNLFVIFVLFISLFAGKKLGITFGLIIGIYLDLLLGRTIGISGILLGIIGFLGEYLDNNFSKESRITIMLMSTGAVILYELAEYIFYIFRLGVNVQIYELIKILTIEIMYNAIIIAIIYPIIQKAGYALENIFKSKNILTRYF